MNLLAMWHGAQVSNPDTKRSHESSLPVPGREDPHRRQARRWPIALLASLAALSTGAHAEAYLPAVGGGGGGQFNAPCAPGQLLAGFELRVGDDVDAIRPLCVMATGPGRTSAAQPATQQWYGGMGGEVQRLLCPQKTPVVIGIDVVSEGVTEVVNNIHLFCGRVVATQTADPYPSAILDAPGYSGAVGVMGKFAGHGQGSLRCPEDQVATGLHGRSGKWLDAMGLICDVPAIPKAPVALGRVPESKPAVALGRVKARRSPTLETSVTAIPPTSTTMEAAVKAADNPHPVVVDPPICTSARQARARNSPAAPSLEAQCRAAGGTP